MADKAGGPIALRVAVLIFVIGVLTSLGAWWSFLKHEKIEVQDATTRASEVIKIDLLNDLEWQIVGLDRLALLWDAADPAQPLWTKNAELYIRHRPGCVAVEWLTPDLNKSIVVTENDKHVTLAFEGVPRDLIAAVSRSHEPMISAPEATSMGGRQWVIAYPVYARGSARGFILTFFDLERSLNYILGDVKNLGFSFAVTLPNQPEYILPGVSRRHEQEWGTIVDVAVPGMTWHLRVWPNTDVVNEIRSLLPELVFAIGCCLSLLLSLAAYFALRLSYSSEWTRHANDALQQEIRTREGAQEELRRAHADLELRIDQRTAELASANALLRREVAEHKCTEDLLRDLNGRLFQIQDDERKRLARELHDGATQNLVALSMNLGMIRDSISPQDLSNKELTDECVHLVDESTKELRTVSYLLHPPYFDELGLGPALRDFAEGFGNRSGIRIKLDIDPKLGRLGDQLELNIFRVIQEALSNIHRHAHSTTASIVLARNAEFVELEIADSGRGIPSEVLEASGGRLAGVGIAGMRERIRLVGGQMKIQSGPCGTEIKAMIPLLDSNMKRRNPGVSALGAVPEGSSFMA